MNSNSLLLIRPATPADAEQILAFILELAEYEKLAHEVVATLDDVERTLFSGERPDAEVVIAEWDSKAAGFALFFPNYSTFLARPGLYLEDLFVRPSFRGRGIGKALLIQLARICTERRYGRLDWSVLNWNESAITFYLGLGARPLEAWTQYRLDGEALSGLAGTDLSAT